MSILGPESRRVRLDRAGLPPGVAADVQTRFEALQSGFKADGSRRESFAWFVPGRIEVVGKHTDYAGGRSLVCTVSRGLAVVARGREDDRVLIRDVGRDSTVMLSPGDTHSSIHWALYPLTVLRRVSSNFPGPLRGVDIAFDSSLPSASGLSSSSALMIAVLIALARANDLDRTALWQAHIHDTQDLAAYAATIENGSGFRGLRGERGVGTEGGSQDHTAVLCSAAGRLSQFSYRPTRREADVDLDPNLTFVVGVSGVRAQKTGRAREDYNRAAQAVGAILAQWRQDTGGSHETLAEAIASAPDAAARLRERLRDRPALVDRLDQFLEEALSIVPEARARLEAHDLDGFGRVVDRSQSLAERLLRNQIAETIDLVRIAHQVGASAASAFGAGFGGSVWALIDTNEAPRFIEKWENAYRRAHPEAAARASFFTTRPGVPAFEAALDD